MDSSIFEIWFALQVQERLKSNALLEKNVMLLDNTISHPNDDVL
jgi:hypothetical protein